MRVLLLAASCTWNRPRSFGKLAFSAMIRRKASAPFVNRSGLAVLAFARAPCRLAFAVRTGVCRVMSASCYRAAGRVRLAVHVRLSSITISKCSDEVANQASSPWNRLLKKFLKKGVAPKIEMSIILSCAKETKRTEEIPR